MQYAHYLDGRLLKEFLWKNAQQIAAVIRYRSSLLVSHLTSPKRVSDDSLIKIIR